MGDGFQLPAVTIIRLPARRHRLEFRTVRIVAEFEHGIESCLHSLQAVLQFITLGMSLIEIGLQIPDLLSKLSDFRAVALH